MERAHLKPWCTHLPTMLPIAGQSKAPTTVIPTSRVSRPISISGSISSYGSCPLSSSVSNEFRRLGLPWICSKVLALDPFLDRISLRERYWRAIEKMLLYNNLRLKRMGRKRGKFSVNREIIMVQCWFVFSLVGVGENGGRGGVNYLPKPRQKSYGYSWTRWPADTHLLWTARCSYHQHCNKG